MKGSVGCESHQISKNTIAGMHGCLDKSSIGLLVFNWIETWLGQHTHPTGTVVCPTNSFTILEPHDQEIGECYAAQNHRVFKLQTYERVRRVDSHGDPTFML